MSSGSAKYLDKLIQCYIPTNYSPQAVQVVEKYNDYFPTSRASSREVPITPPQAVQVVEKCRLLSHKPCM